MGGGYYPTNLIEGLSAVAALISFVNVAGGFVAVQRMLNVYKRPNDPPGQGSNTKYLTRQRGRRRSRVV